MTEEELMLLREAIKSMREGMLTKKEKIIFITGIQAGLHSNDNIVKEMLNEVADMCINGTTEYDKSGKFDN